MPSDVWSCPVLTYAKLSFEDRRRSLQEDQRILQEDQRRRQQEDLPLLTRPTEGTSGPDKVQAVASKVNEAVKKVYKSTGSYVQMLPWVDDHQMHIMNIFTKLCLVEQVDTRGKPQIKGNNMELDYKMFHPALRELYEKMQSETREGNPNKGEMKSYEEIFKFQTHHEGTPIKRIVISGSAGIGKTTLIDKIAYDWAMGNSETLNKFKLVFALKMGSLQQSSNLEDAIFEKLLAKDTVDESALKEFIDKNQDKVLILLDGFDECKITTTDTSSFGSILKVINRKLGPECWVVITSRPPLDKLVNSSLVMKPFTHVRVEGFSKTDINEYVNKFFPDDHDKASKLIEQIELSDTLSDLAESPMLLLLMCLLMGSKENTLPDTMTRLYNKALNYIFKRKTRDIKDAEISRILISIGKVALGSLISRDQSFAFREGDFEKTALDAAMNAGVLTSERVIDGLDTYQRVSFIHHTFLEYCAAMYWQSLINTEEFDRILDQTVKTESTEFTPLGDPRSSRLTRYEYLFRFCCGDNEACTNQILKKIHQGRDSQLIVTCYFESQSKELPQENVISSLLTGDIDISNWNNDSTNAFFHFLKQVAALSRGNDYFSKVKRLVMNDVNFQRFGTDLAKALKLMINLQSLSLIIGSLTPANTDQILLSLATLSTLTQLDLSGNTALGGYVSLLVSQLMKLKRLKKLSLLGCSLVAQDVSPIAESMGDTLVDLDVRGNRALGGCASIWGPELGKMECLQDIHLERCSLQGTDIEPIAVALSDILTLVHLNLGDNQALGGCASLWALHLKRMNHLKELLLVRCNLTDADMEPIAESMGDMPNLSHLDLTGNVALGSCAPLWALHLKRMNHLKVLLLPLCNLTDADMEPIAESVGDMPNLSHLDLTGNDALGSCAPLWALHLKRMNHLKELILATCFLTDADMEPIAESMGDMPNLSHLDLTRNYALGGCAPLWALHLKRMNHLKVLLLVWCNLTDADMEPIAESVGDMPNLSHLDLTRNYALGGCAPLWALHLKRMNHLKELILARCQLTDADMVPIAESVGDMPNLSHLDLTGNDALGSCAPLWALHLKRMNHLKELLLGGCHLTDVDMEPIAESVSDMPNLIHLDPTRNH
ncbi:NACHT, LRR and PYD domains-containing protein 12-like [Asterias rubens]|uniref:NACHT, LRR and PYD domains-containing protein 12-like n=1 Tax=Asterias rubens TaxID=7604 RepID=UPI001455520E|nr:NACHT, LRR and PYD domains-containing protein 12-like [Asterias rubens]